MRKSRQAAMLRRRARSGRDLSRAARRRETAASATATNPSASVGRPPPPVAVGYGLAFASGATALIYEVLWMRKFVTLFGATAPAVSTTLAAIFLGLGLGSAIIGSRSVRFARPLRAFGFVEIGIGLAAALVGPILGMYARVFPSLHAAFADHHSIFMATKTAFAVVALFLPAFLMGGTLALLAQAFTDSSRRTGITGSGLYAANTFGATLGALSVPFLLLPALGMRWGYFSAVSASLSIGAAAWVLDSYWTRLRSRSPGYPGSPAEGAEAEGLSRPKSSSGTPRRTGKRTSGVPTVSVSGTALAAMAFLSGGLTLGIEVLWMRMLAQIHENSIYSFGIVLAIFLVGLSIGAFLAQRVILWNLNPGRSLAFAWIAAGLLILASPGLFYRVTGGLNYVSEFGSPALATLGFATATMLPPTILAGTVLPLLLHLTALSRNAAPGPMVGRLWAQNTAGAVVGPLFVTYVLLPGPGLWLSIAAIGTVMALIGEAVWTTSSRGRSAAFRRLALFGSAAVVLAASNPFTLPRVRLAEDGRERVVHVEEGAHGIVAVLEDSISRWMVLNNFYLLGGTASAMDERRQALIPLSLHPAPRDIAFIGLGTGITAGGAMVTPLERAVAIEIVPEVVRMANRFFGDANLGVLDDPRVETVREDARTYLGATREKFDVIIGDLVVPWRSGESALFTREHFETVLGALAPGGIFCQWLPMFQLSEEQFGIVAATFLDVFPQTTLWRGDLVPETPALALIGHTDPTPLDAAAVDDRIRRWAPVSRGTSPLVSTYGGIWLFLVGPIDASDPRLAQARRNLEDRPWIELLSSLTHLKGGAQAPRVFVGEPLYLYMEEVQAGPLEGSVLAELRPEHLRWRLAGSMLWHASLLLHQGREEDANRRAAESLRLVPAELRRTFGGE